MIGKAGLLRNRGKTRKIIKKGQKKSVKKRNNLDLRNSFETVKRMNERCHHFGGKRYN